MRSVPSCWLVLAALTLLGCAASPAVQDTGDPTPSDPDCPTDSYLSYENVGQPFLANWCTGCHSAQLPVDMRQNAPMGVDFDTLAGTREHLDRIELLAAGDAPTMPPVAGPDPDERALFAEWLACGAL